ncbi:g5538 [Coccomyxa elongata]
MSLREWAKASGTCRSTRAVRLKNLTIKNTPAAGVQWASRMMDGVEALCLSLQSLQQVAQGIARGLYSIKHLQQLILDTPVPSDVALPACLPWLLAQASKLEVLAVANAGEAELPRFPEPPHGLPVGHFYGGHMADQEVDMYGEDDLPDLGDEDEDEDDEEEEDYGWPILSNSLSLVQKAGSCADRMPPRKPKS